MVFVMTPFNFNSGKLLFWNLMRTTVWLGLSRMPEKVYPWVAGFLGRGISQAGSEVSRTWSLQHTTYKQNLAIFMESTMQGRRFEPYSEYKATIRQSQEVNTCPIPSASLAEAWDVIHRIRDTRSPVAVDGDKTTGQRDVRSECESHVEHKGMTVPPVCPQKWER